MSSQESCRGRICPHNHRKRVHVSTHTNTLTQSSCVSDRRPSLLLYANIQVTVALGCSIFSLIHTHGLSLSLSLSVEMEVCGFWGLEHSLLPGFNLREGGGWVYTVSGGWMSFHPSCSAALLFSLHLFFSLLPCCLSRSQQAFKSFCLSFYLPTTKPLHLSLPVFSSKYSSNPCSFVVKLFLLSSPFVAAWSFSLSFSTAQMETKALHYHTQKFFLYWTENKREGWMTSTQVTIQSVNCLLLPFHKEKQV